MTKKPCNVALGRFQPFTKGHLKMLKDGYDKNGYPAVVFMISNKKFDSKHPFSDELIAKEMDIIKKHYKFLVETVPATNADIVKIGQKLDELGYEAHLWLCGDDREAQFKRQAENPKYRKLGNFPDDFTTYTGSGRVEGVSGTAVREAIKNNDIKKFKTLMPDGTSKLFDEFKNEIIQIKESMKNLTNYVKVFESQNHIDTATVADFFQWACLGEQPDGKCEVSQVDNCDVRGLIDNGWYDIFGDDKASENKVKQFFKKNWDKTIKVHSTDTHNDCEVWFELDGKEYVASFISCFGEIEE